MKKIIFLFLSISILFSCNQTDSQKKDTGSFSFVFMTDIHLQPELSATEGFMQAIDTINSLNPAFVVTGGDVIMDALGQTFGRSDSLYNLYNETKSKLKMLVYNTIGNHDVFGLYEESGIDPENDLYGKGMYEERLAKRYYSFNEHDWHFIVLDGIGFTENRRYYGYVDSLQIEWLKKDLQETGKETPVVVTTHIPLLSVGEQIMNGPTEGFNEGSIITNADKIIPILENYNVKMVLQGHLHFLEDINYNGIHYITGGAVCSSWWRGKRLGLEEGFLKIDVKGENFSWEYIDFGWVVE